jgi:hypothetical protein
VIAGQEGTAVILLRLGVGVRVELADGQRVDVGFVKAFSIVA